MVKGTDWMETGVSKAVTLTNQASIRAMDTTDLLEAEKSLEEDK